MKRPALFSVCAIALALAAGCGSARNATPRGVLVIGIQREGGGMNDHQGQLFGGRVELYNGHGRFVGAVELKDGSTTAVELPPGHYSVGLGHGRPTVDQLQGCLPEIADVIAGATTPYTLYQGCWAI